MKKLLVAIHQPHYLPWLPYMHKVAVADLFIILDDVQFVKGDWHNRNKIKSATGPLLLTVPVIHKNGQLLNDTGINNQTRWRDKHWQSIVANYAGTPFFSEFRSILEPIYRYNWDSLVDLNVFMLNEFIRALGLKSETLLASRLRVDTRGTERLVQLCQNVGADGYISGEYALSNYLQPDKFEQAGLELWVQEWTCPVYPQRFPKADFCPNLSLLDLLLNVGASGSRNHIMSGGLIKRLV